MRPRKVTVVRYMIIYIYIYTDSAGVDRTRRGSLRLAPIIGPVAEGKVHLYIGVGLSMVVVGSP